MAGRVTIYDVAEKAGVGIGTVSRAMNNSPLIHEETKNRVLKVARELNYLPHAVAQSLARKRTNTIGVIVPFFTNYFFVELLRAIQKLLAQYDYDLNLYSVDDVTRGIIFLDRVIRERRVDGVLYISLPIDDEYVDRIKRSTLPIVLVDSFHKSLDSIIIENLEGAFTATNHLIQLGHRRIAMINGNLRSLPAVERLDGYKKALTCHGIAFDEDLVVICDNSRDEDGFNEEAGYMAMKKLLERRAELPTAVFISSDIQAIGAVRAIQEAELQIPEDIALVGFDDIQFAKFLGLTTIHQPILDMGRLAVERLKERMNGRQVSVYQKKLKTHLIVRRTCGASIQGIQMKGEKG